MQLVSVVQDLAQTPAVPPERVRQVWPVVHAVLVQEVTLFMQAPVVAPDCRMMQVRPEAHCLERSSLVALALLDSQI